ncbi:hypothetical protein J40TS1_41140 [Paenibacillus montaniterrae]|uniref:Uncharacterized protein n=1 Tax=Paenibacillus montaniterrae TaxID=429341 RepID=A0A920CVS1_9BACL|nr:hypothetical protein [Paenibacillus montaniterrae]GIP18472.1 hypothetical protein J40TS1_41140 [Paenibacillus montaniterrae]
MKKILGYLLSLGLLFSLILQPTATAATENTEKSEPVNFQFEAFLTLNNSNHKTSLTSNNVQNNKQSDFEIKDAKQTLNQINEDGSFTASYEVTLSLPNTEFGSGSQSGLITPFDSNSGSVTQNLCKATLEITYFTRGSTDKEIKITNIKGGWEPQNSTIVVSNREASVSDGLPLGNVIRKNPTTNSFNYNTGWDYVDLYPHTNYSGPRGYTEATLTAYGMGGTANIFLQVLVQ